ncbi:MAG: A24 family peptidase [Alphaproteobacteria bacterium]
MLTETLIHQLVIAVFAGVLVVAAAGDFRSFRIPNSLVLSILVLYPAHVIAAPGPVAWGYALVFSFVILAVGAGFFAANMMGGGDVKLMAAVSLWAGPQHLLSFFVITLAVSMLVACAMAARMAAADTRSAQGWSVMAVVSNFRHVPILKMSVPYGVGISAAGLYIAWRILAG